MMKRFIYAIVSTLLFLALLAGVSPAADKVINMEFSSFLPATEKLSLLLQEWCKDVETRTNGRVKIAYHPGGTLTPAQQTYDSVVNEIVDIGFGPIGATPGRFPLMEVMDLPLGIKSAYAGTRMFNELYRKFNPKELANVKVLFMLSAPPAVIHSKRPVKTLEDLQGLKLRSLGGSSVKVMQALGAVPVVISTGDTYDALQKGVVEGAIVLFDALEALRWGDSLKFSTVITRTSLLNNGYFVMNKNRWSELPQDIKDIFDKMSEEYMVKCSRLWDQKEQDVIAGLPGKQHTTHTLRPEEEERWYQKVLPVFDEYVKEKTAKGLPAAEALQFCRDWVKANQN